MQFKGEQITARQLDQGDFQGSETVIIKIPINLPYLPQSTREERIYGSLIIHGKWFNEVSQRLFADTMYVKCVQDNRKQKLTGLLHDFISFEFGKSPISNHQTDFFAKSLLKEYLPLTQIAFFPPAPGPSIEFSRWKAHLPPLVIADQPSPPPRAV